MVLLVLFLCALSAGCLAGAIRTRSAPATVCLSLAAFSCGFVGSCLAELVRT